MQEDATRFAMQLVVKNKDVENYAHMQHAAQDKAHRQHHHVEDIGRTAHQKAASACTSASKLSSESTTWALAIDAGGGPTHKRRDAHMARQQALNGVLLHCAWA
jgi:hypothetical protein